MDIDRFVELEGLWNFRDVGGYPAGSGSVRRARVYRSDALYDLSGTGLDALRALGVAAVFDLRSGRERDDFPGPLPSVHVEVFQNVTGDAANDVLALFGRPAGEAFLRDFYLQMLELSAAKIGQILSALIDASALPAVIHCAAGKDRTGVTVALLLSVLGVERELVLDDYCLTGAAPGYEANLAKFHPVFVAGGIDSDAALGMMSTPRWAMAEALDLLDEQHGGVEDYLLGPAGMSPGELDALRAVLVE